MLCPNNIERAVSADILGLAGFKTNCVVLARRQHKEGDSRSL